jgi:hypothetical protein
MRFYCYAECRNTECYYAECCYAKNHFVDCHYSDCHFAERQYAGCHYAQCHYTEYHGFLMTNQIINVGTSKLTYEKFSWTNLRKSGSSFQL